MGPRGERLALDGQRTVGRGCRARRRSARSVLWIAGVIMCDGRSSATCTMYSPRSVSTTSTPIGLERGAEVDLLGGHRLRLHDGAAPTPRRRGRARSRRASSGVAARWTVAPTRGERRLEPVEPAVEIGERPPGGCAAASSFSSGVVSATARPCAAGCRGCAAPAAARGSRPRGRPLAKLLARVTIRMGTPLRLLDRSPARALAYAAPEAPRHARPLRPVCVTAGPRARSSAKWTGCGPVPVRRRRPSRCSRHAVSPLTRNSASVAAAWASLSSASGSGDLAVLDRERARRSRSTSRARPSRRSSRRPPRAGAAGASPDAEVAQPVAGVVHRDAWRRRVAPRSTRPSSCDEVLRQLEGLGGDRGGAVPVAAVEEAVVPVVDHRRARPRRGDDRVERLEHVDEVAGQARAPPRARRRWRRAGRSRSAPRGTPRRTPRPRAGAPTATPTSGETWSTTQVTKRATLGTSGTVDVLACDPDASGPRGAPGRARRGRPGRRRPRVPTVGRSNHTDGWYVARSIALVDPAAGSQVRRSCGPPGPS